MQRKLCQYFTSVKQNVEAIDEINKIEEDSYDLTSKAIYIRAIAYLSINDLNNGCIDLRRLLNTNTIPQGFYNNFCNKVN